MRPIDWDRAFKYLLIGGFILGALGFVGSLNYSTSLIGVSPAQPDPQSGQLVPLNEHGYVYYVQDWQAWLSREGGWLGWGVGFICMAIYHTRYGEHAALRKTNPRLYWSLIIVLIASVLAIPFVAFKS